MFLLVKRVHFLGHFFQTCGFVVIVHGIAEITFPQHSGNGLHGITNAEALKLLFHAFLQEFNHRQLEIFLFEAFIINLVPRNHRAIDFKSLPGMSCLIKRHHGIFQKIFMTPANRLGIAVFQRFIFFNHFTPGLIAAGKHPHVRAHENIRFAVFAGKKNYIAGAIQHLQAVKNNSVCVFFIHTILPLASRHIQPFSRPVNRMSRRMLPIQRFPLVGIVQAYRAIYLVELLHIGRIHLPDMTYLIGSGKYIKFFQPGILPILVNHRKCFFGEPVRILTHH